MAGAVEGEEMHLCWRVLRKLCRAKMSKGSLEGTEEKTAHSLVEQDTCPALDLKGDMLQDERLCALHTSARLARARSFRAESKWGSDHLSCLD